MKKLVLTYGLIAGLLSSAWMTISVMAGFDHMDTSMGMLLGFASMILGFSFIFVAVRKYRDDHSGGTITFGKAFKIGLYISLIAATIYVISWLIDYYFFIPDFMEQYAAKTIEQMRTDGVPAATIEAEAADMAKFREMYKNPLFVAAITYTEILPVGLIISLICALILKRSPKPAY